MTVLLFTITITITITDLKKLMSYFKGEHLQESITVIVRTFARMLHKVHRIVYSLRYMTHRKFY